MPADIECEHCGGTEFYKEAGFFYCKGCQVQSQEVQEYVFDDFAAENPTTKTKKVQSEKAEKDNKITSWECYNYILLGLTHELINLGASRTLKPVVKFLWLRYLEKMQVFKIGKEWVPKLQAVCSEMDGEIVYGKLAKRKRIRAKSSSSETDSKTLDSSSMKYERIKRRRALVKAQYDDFSQKSQGTPSLHNETLTSLQTGSEKSSRKAKPISYNVYASKEIRRLQKSKYHWHKHQFDFERHLRCHRPSYRKLSYKYRKSPYLLSLNKLYSILYLGLLIIKDKIQLSDMLRFIKEGKLSFNYYSHFFPEDFSDKILNFRNFKKNCLFANTPFRVITSQMSAFLDVEYFVSTPNLVELCERYCKELNLPQEVYNCAVNILSKVKMSMSYRKKLNRVPNYEGRVLSVILFVLKLLFGLDDVTEFHLSKYAELLNRSSAINPKMFNVIEWLRYIEYRDLVMANSHFPTNFIRDCDVKDVNLALGTLSRKEYPGEGKFHETKDKYKQLLTKLKDELYYPESLELPVTLTPFLNYVKLLPKTKYLEILTTDFGADSLNYLLKPKQYLRIVNKKKLEIVHAGANDDWILEKVICVNTNNRCDLSEKRQLITVKLNFNQSPKEETRQEEKLNCEERKHGFNVANGESFEKNQRRLDDQDFHDVNLDVKKIRKEINVSVEDYPRHYNPYERFWMRTKLRLEKGSQKDCIKFLKMFPNNFRLVFRELQRIAQQTEQEFLIEYQMTELSLVCFANYGKKTRNQEILKNRLISNYLKDCVHFW